MTTDDHHDDQHAAPPAPDSPGTRAPPCAVRSPRPAASPPSPRTFLAWTWTAEFPGDLTVYGYPGGLQVLTLVAAPAHRCCSRSPRSASAACAGSPPPARPRPCGCSALGAFATTWFTVIAIAVELGGLVNLEPGGWVAGRRLRRSPSSPRFLLHRTTPGIGRRRAPRTAPLLGRDPRSSSAVFALGLYVFTYGIDTEYAELFIGYLIAVGFAAAALFKAGLIARLVGTHRASTATSPWSRRFVAAIAFPFTQNNDQLHLIGVNILIFATVALGLNIVVGLAGLLDLGYVAFLGVGAYTAALVSGSTASAIRRARSRSGPPSSPAPPPP